MGNKYLLAVGDIPNTEDLPQTDEIFAVGNRYSYFLSSAGRHL